jgi:hypothetical protein
MYVNVTDLFCSHKIVVHGISLFMVCVIPSWVVDGRGSYMYCVLSAHLSFAELVVVA